MPPPALIVTIDTEEEGLWSNSYRPHGHTVRNIRGVVRLQELCDRYAIKPTYLIDTPVIEDGPSVELFREIHDSGRAEIGGHLHPWCGPPFEEECSRETSYMCNLPEELQRAKLAHLTESIEHRFGHRPTSFRAGRYGLDITGARILSQLGYKVDSSVTPFMDSSPTGGPNFEHAPWTPYEVGGDDLSVPVAEGFLVEVPVAIGFNRKHMRLAHRVRELAFHCRRLRAVGILDRTGLVRRIKFSPEQATAKDMNRLVDVYLSLGVPCLVMMFHSSSLVAGLSPYVPDSDALERFYANLQSTFRYCIQQKSMAAQTLSEFAELWMSRREPRLVPQ